MTRALSAMNRVRRELDASGVAWKHAPDGFRVVIKVSASSDQMAASTGGAEWPAKSVLSAMVLHANEWTE
jgi:hypothetical protein